MNFLRSFFAPFNSLWSFEYSLSLRSSSSPFFIRSWVLASSLTSSFSSSTFSTEVICLNSSALRRLSSWYRGMPFKRLRNELTLDISLLTVRFNSSLSILLSLTFLLYSSLMRFFSFAWSKRLRSSALYLSLSRIQPRALSFSSSRSLF